MATDQQLNTIDRYFTAVWDNGDLEAIDEIFTADFQGNKIAEEWAAFVSQALLQLMSMDPR
jgi:ketosteroid isomerase-like protein